MENGDAERRRKTERIVNWKMEALRDGEKRRCFLKTNICRGNKLICNHVNQENLSNPGQNKTFNTFHVKCYHVNQENPSNPGQK